MTSSLDHAAAWKDRFRVPLLGWTRLAKAMPARGVAGSNRSGTYQLYAWDVPSGALTQLTHRPTGVATGYIAPDGAYVYYLEDYQGNERGHIVRVPFNGGPSQNLTPELAPYSLLGLDINHTGAVLVCTVAGDAGFSLRRIALSSEAHHEAQPELYHSDRLMLHPVLSYHGDLAATATLEAGLAVQYSLVVVDTENGRLLGTLSAHKYGSVEPVGFAPRPHDTRLLVTAREHGSARPLIWDIERDTPRTLRLPELEGDVQALDWLPDGTAILLCHFARAVQQLYLYDLQTEQLRKINHPSGTYGLFTGEFEHIGYAGLDGMIYTHWQDSTHPPQLLTLSTAGTDTPTTTCGPGEEPTSRPWRSITFASSDGAVIQGWLAQPAGPGPFPTIVHLHGGPRTVMTEMYAPECQMWLDHGFAHLTINYRGSTTFGWEFERHIWGRLGHWEVEDIVAARAWLLDQNIALPHQIFVTGRSYGGYLTLLALGKYPTLWAGGMAGVAITDWFMQYEEAAEPLKAYQIALFGGPPHEQAARYHASSPITYAAQVDAPLLVMQGLHDTRCSVRGMQAYEARLKALGKHIDVHWFDAGHGVFDAETQIAHAERMLQFAHDCLNRQQRSELDTLSQIMADKTLCW